MQESQGAGRERHPQISHVAFPIDDVFDLVEAVEHYPEFLPWCAAATVLSRDDTEVSARITVGHGDLHFDFVTRNPMRRPEFMAIHLEKGPFRRIEGEWHLSRLGVDACRIEFALRYEFENPVIAATARLASCAFASDAPGRCRS